MIQISDNKNLPENFEETTIFLNPISLDQEELILDYFLRVLKRIKSSFKIPEEKDDYIIKNERDSIKNYFSVIFS